MSHDAPVVYCDWPYALANGEGKAMGRKLGGEPNERAALSSPSLLTGEKGGERGKHPDITARLPPVTPALSPLH